MSTAVRAQVDHYRDGDLEALYDVCLRTAAIGDDASAHYRDGNLVGHIAMAPYVYYEPELAFVLRASAEGEALGYVVATSNTPAFEEWCEQHWWPPLRQQYPLDGDYTPEERRRVNHIHEPSTPSRPWLGQYPAHLHINLLPPVRGDGNGGRLLTCLFTALQQRHVPGVHLGVDARNTGAIGFYYHHGLTVLRDTGTSFILARQFDEQAPLSGPTEGMG